MADEAPKKETDVLRRGRDRERRDKVTAILLGPTGVGRSQLIEHFAQVVFAQGHRLSVLTAMELEQRFPPPEGYEPPLTPRPEWRGRYALVLQDEV